MGQKIADIRLRKGMSVYALSKTSGVTQSYISKLENNRMSNPGVNVLQRLADALGCSVNDLWEKEVKKA